MALRGYDDKTGHYDSRLLQKRTKSFQLGLLRSLTLRAIAMPADRAPKRSQYFLKQQQTPLEVGV